MICAQSHKKLTFLAVQEYVDMLRFDVSKLLEGHSETDNV